MDELNIQTEFTTNLISDMIKKWLRKSGYDVDVQLNKVNATVTDGIMHVHLDVDAEIEEAQLKRIFIRKTAKPTE